MSKSRLAGPILAVLISVAFILWMVSGASKEGDTVITNAGTVKSLIPSVQVVTSNSRQVQQSLAINGITEADRFVTIRSEATGKVLNVYKQDGDTVKAGEVIVRLDTQDLPARIRQVQAFLDQTRLEYEGAKKLRLQGLLNEAQLAASLTNLEQAKSQLASLTLQLDNFTIRASFAGQIENTHIELGSYIRQGDAIADVYDYSQLKFVGAVSEKDIQSLKLKQQATVELISGDTVGATVSYIGSVTNPATRTFQVELTVPKVGRFVSGVTSVASVQLGLLQGHYISPALLFINDDGLMGLKTLDAAQTVQFREISIIHSDPNGVWVEGLDNQADIIVVGQGFVTIGDVTNPVRVPFDADIAVGI